MNPLRCAEGMRSLVGGGFGACCKLLTFPPRRLDGDLCPSATGGGRFDGPRAIHPLGLHFESYEGPPASTWVRARMRGKLHDLSGFLTLYPELMQRCGNLCD